MKRIFSFAAAAALLFGAASCQKALTPGQEGDCKVAFSFELPEEAATKADIADGSIVDEIIYRIYVGNDVMYSGTIEKVNGAFTLEQDLVTGQTYDLLFWAQKKGTGFYDTRDLKNVGINYGGRISNDETRDAFFGSRVGFEPTGIATEETIYLYRPFAQVNFATSENDWNSASTFVNDGNKANRLKSSVVFDRLPSRFNVMAGDIVAGHYDENVVFEYNTAPALQDAHGNEDWIGYDEKRYAWVAMNYVLASKGEMTVKATAKFEHKKNIGSPLTREVPNVPVMQNYRTNILGEFFTGGNVFNIVIVPGFVDSMNNNDNTDDVNNPDYILTIPIRKTFELGGEVSLTENLTISSPFKLTNGKEVKVNLNGFNITCQNGSDAFVVENGTLTIEGNGTVKTQDNTAGYGVIADGANAVVYVKGGNFVVGVDDVATYGEYAANSAVYVKNGGKAYVSGGTFKVETEQAIDPVYKTRFLINLKDLTNAGQDGNEIVVTGGTFYEFNPANNIAEGANTTFVNLDYYKSTETAAGVWTVTKK